MKIEWTRKALKQHLKLPAQVQTQILAAVATLADWPECRNVKSLQGKDGYRLRVGAYRVIFEVDTAIRIILVKEVKKRDERTYH
ncbi:type II toxin-antitoxin system RelE family toxin [Desulfocurvibacter africanus]|uniref:Plasmid stabilization system n=1 Tax=Desulfocurvibacter africanus subsp. africanus str. Walvis Bay TaxID=690850 RepID=F3YZ98_DESAF|nr:type II toxin-antitoxin system RelE/ParE family toxin [Desulfocurvibacter africanus]EGJ50854.1 plasmid stabilization system [Desulfocurvibacter africanus subsp. africanus str. Walvis Bay]